MLLNLQKNAKKCFFFKRADHVVFFLDCEKLISIEERQVTKNTSALWIRLCIENGMIGKKTSLEIFFSKWDIIANIEDNQEHIRFIGNVKQNIKKKFGSKVGAIEFFKIAARPEVKSKLKKGYGINKVFPLWVENSLMFTKNIQESKPVSSEREFSNYFWKK